MNIIDRFEGNVAVVETGDGYSFENIDRALLPSDANEGDVIVLVDGRWVVDFEKTAERREVIRGLLPPKGESE